MDNLSPSPEKIENPKTQPINQDVFNLLKTQGKKKYPDDVTKAKERLLQVLKTAKVDPQTVIQAGKFAQAGLKNPQMYQLAIQNAIKAQLITPEMVKPGGIDYQLLAQGITAGKLTEELVKEGRF